MTRAPLLPLVAVLAATSLAGPAGSTGQGRSDTGPPSLPRVSAGQILADTKTLASDEFEGRAPGTKGEATTVTWLTEQFRRIGLEPGNPDGTFVQKVPMVGITAAETQPLSIAGRPGTPQTAVRQTFPWGEAVVAWTKHVAERAAINDSELVFAGYGVEAPEFNWNDFKDADVKGKTIVVLVNDPPVPDPSNPARLDPKTFGGDAMTYYGRWTYKFEEGARRGAAGVLIVHETERAGYPFSVVQGNLKEKFDLVTPDRNMGRSAIEGWVTHDAARQILALAGQDLDALKKKALARDFRPVPLGLNASLAIRNTLRTLDSTNVVAKLAGADPALRGEYVIYTAHWDHFGIGATVGGDRIYNGALDNASGVASVLEIARALSRAQPRPKRSILFLMVTAEEQGLIGSEYYTISPLYPLSKTVAVINVDGVNQWGRTRDVTVVGLGASDLDDYLREAAREQGRTLTPDPEPEKGFYYRSDHFPFAKRGVPALNPDAGVQYVGKPESYGKQKRDEYTNRDYHAPSDEVKPDWDLSGAAEDAQLLLTVGFRVANADKWPEWKPGNEFKARRDAMLRGGR